MIKVALVYVENYEYSNVLTAVKKGIDLIGGIDKFIKTSDKVLLKPNFLAAEVAEKSVTTHPSVFNAIGTILTEKNISVSYGDSPGIGKVDGIAKKSGIYSVAERLGIKLVSFDEKETVFFERGKQNKSFTIAKTIKEHDALISLPKLKTHALTTLTGAIKNQFGCVPGTLKAQFHLKIPDLNNFTKMLVDLNELINPKLIIMDAIVAMEGNGPRSGSPRKLNVLLFSSDAIAIDAVASRIVSLNPKDIPTVKNGFLSGFGVKSEDEIKIVGDNIEKFIVHDFEMPHKKRSILRLLSSMTNTKLGKKIFNTFLSKPVIIENICVKCGVCVEVCPVTPLALNFEKNGKTSPPEYDYSKCIKCYCCQELCPHRAIKLKGIF